MEKDTLYSLIYLSYLIMGHGGDEEVKEEIEVGVYCIIRGRGRGKGSFLSLSLCSFSLNSFFFPFLFLSLCLYLSKSINILYIYRIYKNRNNIG